MSIKKHLSRVDFSYAFGYPHRLTVARPDSSDKTLLDLRPGSLTMLWAYENLTTYPLGSYQLPATEWEIVLTPEIDNKPFITSTWTRLDGFLPMIDNGYTDARGSIRLSVAGADSAALVQIDISNTDDRKHVYTVNCAIGSKWGCRWAYNPGSLDEADIDTILAGQNGRADRIMILGTGAQEYGAGNQSDSIADMPPINLAPGAASSDSEPAPWCGNPGQLRMTWHLDPGERAVGWIVRPYEAYQAQLPTLRTKDWAVEFEQAKEEWRNLIERASAVEIPDSGVRNAFLACLCDIFIMREPVADGYLAGIPGTECARSANDAEPAIMAICLDQLGYHREAEDGYQMCLDQQGTNGDWATPLGWSNHWWAATGFKSWAVIEHYKLTGNRAYLERTFSRMLASSKFQEKQRARTRKMEDGRRPLTYGLMSRGNGDCGLGPFGRIYLPHNIWAVFADACAVEAAEILGRMDDLAELREIHRRALEDLLYSLDHGAIREDDYRWIPAQPGLTEGSRWGALNVLFPCRILPPDHELVSGTISKMESKMSLGGLPLATGFMADGMWVALALDHLAEAHLVRGDGDAVEQYLYAVLNHSTPLYTWCEERGQEPGTDAWSGDRHHLFTPVAVVRIVRDLLVMEDQREQGLHLARGTPRSWLASGGPVGIGNAPTHFGPVSYRIRYDSDSAEVRGQLEFPKTRGLSWCKLYLRLPSGLKVESISSTTRAAVMPEDSGLAFESPRGKYELLAKMAKGRANGTDKKSITEKVSQ